MVYQHFALFESVSVVENIALAVKGTFDLDGSRLRSRPCRRATACHRSAPAGCTISPSASGNAWRSYVASCSHPSLLILDEPTSVLTPQAVVKLFETLRQLASEGCSIVYISHKLDEVQELCDTARCCATAKVTGTAKTQGTRRRLELARMMVGSQLPQMHVSPSAPSAKPLLEVRGPIPASARDKYGTELTDVSLEVHGGEIVGLAGVSGNGQAELIALLSGERTHRARRRLLIGGRPSGTSAPANGAKLGHGFSSRRNASACAVPPTPCGRTPC